MCAEASDEGVDGRIAEALVKAVAEAHDEVIPEVPDGGFGEGVAEAIS